VEPGEPFRELIGRRRGGAVVAGAALLAVCVTFDAATAESVADAFDRVHRSVVVVRTTERGASASGDRRSVSVVGSGVLIDLGGQVLTAAHLVGAASECASSSSTADRSGRA